VASCSEEGEKRVRCQAIKEETQGKQRSPRTWRGSSGGPNPGEVVGPSVTEPGQTTPVEGEEGGVGAWAVRIHVEEGSHGGLRASTGREKKERRGVWCLRVKKHEWRGVVTPQNSKF
jgi:hypothetical protein